MQIEIATTTAAVLDLAEDWNELHRRSGSSPFAQHAWVSGVLRTFRAETLAFYLVYAERRKLVAVFPFSIWEERRRGKVYKVLGAGAKHITDYTEFLIDPAINPLVVIKRVVHELVHSADIDWDLVHLENMNDRNVLMTTFRRLLLDSIYGGEIASMVTPSIDLARPFSESKKLSNVRRRFRKLGNETKTHHLSGRDITPAMIGQLSSIHQQSFPTAAFDTDRVQDFIRALIADAVARDMLQLSFIEHKGEMIAGHFGFQDRDNIYYYVPAFDQDYSSFGPGQYLLGEMINMASETGRARFDLLRGDEDYKYNWANNIGCNYSVIGVRHESAAHGKLLVNAALASRTLPLLRNRGKS